MGGRWLPWPGALYEGGGVVESVDMEREECVRASLFHPAIGAMAEGLRDQLRHFWLHALPMLYEPQGHRAEVEMECRGVCAVDDLKVMYAPAGINDDADRVHVDY